MNGTRNAPSAWYEAVTTLPYVQTAKTVEGLLMTAVMYKGADLGAKEEILGNMLGTFVTTAVATGLVGGLVAGRSAFFTVPRVSLRMQAGELGVESLVSTGGRQLNTVQAIFKADDEAVAFYEAIRNSSSDVDVKLISKNVEMPIFQVQKIKNHLFFDRHQLSTGIERFAPDIEIADAWVRLQKGNFVKQDINLLQHEYFEARFKGIFRTDYVTAHNAANDSLRIWNPNEFVTTPKMSRRF